MATPITRTLRGRCTAEGAAVTLSFPVTEVLGELRTSLDKQLQKQGIGTQWSDGQDAPELLIRITEVDQGNQLLRYLLPFIAPAVLDVEGQIAANGKPPRPFHVRKKAQMGLLGGSARGMLKSCANQCAKMIANEVKQALR